MAADATKVFFSYARDDKAFVDRLEEGLRKAGLEILPDVRADEETVGQCRALGTAGYQLALGGFAPSAVESPLLDCVQYLKIHFPSLTLKERTKLLAAVRAREVDPYTAAEELVSTFEPRFEE